MAEQAVEIEAASGSDVAEHERTYHFFVRLVRYAALGIIAVLALMAMFLV